MVIEKEASMLTVGEVFYLGNDQVRVVKITSGAIDGEDGVQVVYDFIDGYEWDVTMFGADEMVEVES